MYKARLRLRLCSTIALVSTALGFLPANSANAQRKQPVEVVAQVGSQGINSVAFSPDSLRLAAANSDGTLRLWDVATGQLILTFYGHDGGTQSVAFSPDGARLVSGGVDQTVRVWDTTTGANVYTLRPQAYSITSVAFSPDGSKLAAGTSSKLMLWDAYGGTLLRDLPIAVGGISSVAFSSDGKRLLAGGASKPRLYDTTTGQILSSFPETMDSGNSVAMAPNGHQIMVGGLSFDRNFNRVGFISLFETSTGRLTARIQGDFDEVASVAFSLDGRLIFSASADGSTRLWEASTGRLLRIIEGGSPRHPRETSSRISSVVFSPDGGKIASAGSTTKVWDVPTGQLLKDLHGRSRAVRSVTFCSMGERIVSGNADGAVRLWDRGSGRLLQNMRAHSKSVGSVACSKDGTAAVSASEDRSIKLWDTRTGKVLRTFAGHKGTVSSLTFSSDGGFVLTGGYDDFSIKLWETKTGKLLRSFGKVSHAVIGLAISPDNKTAAIAGVDLSVNEVFANSSSLSLWDVGSGRMLRPYVGHSTFVTSVAFSLDGRRLVTGGGDHTVRIWDVVTGRPLHTLKGHPSIVDAVAFSPDGKQVISGGRDSTIKLWDTATGQLLESRRASLGEVTSLVFSSSGEFLSGDSHGVIRLWKPSSEEPLLSTIGAEDGEWVAMTTEGFFDASSQKAANLLAIVRGLDVIGIEQVRQSLFNPDLVREKITGDPGGEVAEAGRVMSLEKVLDSGPAPLVAITSPTAGSQSAIDLVTVAAGIEDRGKGVGRIEWRVNGITAAVVAKPPGSGRAYNVTRQLALDPGDNAIEVVAYNGSNLLASLPARTTVRFTGPADKVRPKLHILAIGINAYEDKGWTPPGSKDPLLFEPLDLAVADAKAFAASMKKAVAGLYEEVRITLALDQEATRENLPKIVEKLAAQIHPRDTFILFAAAHGYSTKTNGRFYLIPQDHQNGIDPEALATRAIGQDELQDWLANRIKAKRALILLDTCESGALIAGHARSRTDAPASEVAVGRLHEATGRPILTAAAVGQSAQEGEIGASGAKHGLFTWAVLDALRKGDANGNGLIELSELVSHVQAVIPRIAAKGGSRGRAVTSETEWEKQSARFGSRGEDFVVARRLP